MAVAGGPGPGREQAVLVLEGEGQSQAQAPCYRFELQIGRVIRLGRHAYNDVVLKLEGVSSTHVELHVLPGSPVPLVVARDVSKNGTWLELPPAPRAPLLKDADTPLRDGALLVLPLKVNREWQPHETDARGVHHRARLRVRFVGGAGPEPAATGGGGGRKSGLGSGEVPPRVATLQEPDLPVGSWSLSQPLGVDVSLAATHRGSLGVSTAAPRAGLCRRVQYGVNRWPIQLLLLLLSLAYCIGHIQSVFQKQRVDDPTTEAHWLLFTGAPLELLSMLEFLVLVAAQAGICSFWRFFRPLFHRFQALILVGLLASVGESTYMRWAEETDTLYMPSNDGDRYRITISFVLLYRLLRIWAICLGISVQATDRARQQLLAEKRSGKWADEHAREKDEYRSRRMVRLQGIIDHPCTQFVIILVVLAYCLLYSTTISWRYLRDRQIAHDLTSFTKPAGYILLAVFLCELFVRCLAQEGERFFAPIWHKVEVFVLSLGLLNLGYASWYTNALRERHTWWEPQGSLTAALLVVHRILRVIGIRCGVTASHVDATSVLSVQVAEWLRMIAGDVLAIPPGNISVNLDNGVIVSVRKAMVKPEVLGEFHLPVALRGVLLEELYIHLPQVSSLLGSLGASLGLGTGAGGKEVALKSGRSVLRLRGAVVLLGPGPGLAEAGEARAGGSAGLVRQVPENSYWVYERILEARARVVEVICKQMPWALMEELDEVRPIIYRCLAHWELDIKPALVQYSDPHGLLGTGPAVIEVKVGSLWARYLQGAAAVADITRVAVCVRCGIAKDEALAEALHLSELEPRCLMREVKLANMSDMLRWWSMEALARGRRLTRNLRHQRAERWKPGGSGCVLSLLWVRARAGGGSASPVPPREEEDLDAPVGETGQEARSRGIGHHAHFELAGRHIGELLWRVQTHPVRLAVDDLQLQYISKLALCARAWLLRDYAYRWRPVLPPGDPQLSVGDRRTVARLWWWFAIHRVLADVPGAAPRAPWMEQLWLTPNRRQYADLLALHRKTPMQPWEVRWLQELQLILPFEDVIILRGREWRHTNWLRPPKEMTTPLVPISEPVDPFKTFGGKWLVLVPLIESTLLRSTIRGARPVLLRTRLERLTIDASVANPLLATGSPGGGPLAVTLALHNLAVSCPQAGPLTLGLGQSVCSVHRGLLPGPPPRPPLLEGSLRTRPLAFELRAAVEPAPNSAGGAVTVLCTVRLAELRVMLCEPLVVELSGLVEAHCFYGLASGLALAGRKSYKEAQPTTSAIPIVVRHRGSPGEALTVVNGRAGLLTEFFQLIDTEAAMDSLLGRSKLQARAGALRDSRAVSEAVRGEAAAYEAATCSRGGLHAWELQVDIGVLRCAQVGEYSREELVVEDLCLGPFRIRAQREAGSAAVMLDQEWQEADCESSVATCEEEGPPTPPVLLSDIRVFESRPELEGAVGQGPLSWPPLLIAGFCSHASKPTGWMGQALLPCTAGGAGSATPSRASLAPGGAGERVEEEALRVPHASALCPGDALPSRRLGGGGAPKSSRLRRSGAAALGEDGSGKPSAPPPMGCAPGGAAGEEPGWSATVRLIPRTPGAHRPP